MKLTFENVLNKNYELDYEIPEKVGQRYEELTSFRRGRDFNVEVKEYVENFVEIFRKFMTDENEQTMNERLSQYNKLVVDLRTKILSSTTIPSVMICGGSKYPLNKKNKELARTHNLESELYSNNGKHARFIANTRKMFDPIVIDSNRKLEQMRIERAEDKGWEDSYTQVEHDEISGYGIDVDNQRVYITTHGKPDEETRTLLKKAALRWSPKNERWQRILTINGIHTVNKLIEQVTT